MLVSKSEMFFLMRGGINKNSLIKIEVMKIHVNGKMDR